MAWHDTIIIGAGPAGIQLAYFLQKAHRDYLILEGSAQPAQFFRQYPRHRKLLSINKRFTGREDEEYNFRHDWNSLLSDDKSLQMRCYSKEYFPSAEDLVTYLEDFIAKEKLKITYGTRIQHISQCTTSKIFTLQTNTEENFQCQRLVMATGVEKPYIPNIPGIELTTDYAAMSLNQKIYENKNVLIIGKGNSALETADHLIGYAAAIHLISPNPIKLAWDTRFVGHIRAINNNFFDTYHLKSQNVSMDGNIIKIWRNQDSNKIVVRFHPLHAPQEIEQLEYDHVLLCTGFRFNNDLFTKNCKPAMTDCGKLPLMTHSFESTNIKNLFFAGTITQMLDYKKSQSAFIHGFRYNVRTLFNFMEERFEKKPLPFIKILRSPEILASTIIKHLNRVSSLWQQVGFLTDVLLLKEDECLWYRDLPHGYLAENKKKFSGEFLTVRFQLQPCPGKTFIHPRTSDIYEGHKSTAIHPVIEYYVNGEIHDRFHMLEDLLADWSGEDYVNSMIEFFKAVLSGKKFIPQKQSLSKEGGEIEIIRDIVRDDKMKLKNAVV